MEATTWGALSEGAWPTKQQIQPALLRAGRGGAGGSRGEGSAPPVGCSSPSHSQVLGAAGLNPWGGVAQAPPPARQASRVPERGAASAPVPTSGRGRTNGCGGPPSPTGPDRAGASSSPRSAASLPGWRENLAASHGARAPPRRSYTRLGAFPCHVTPPPRFRICFQTSAGLECACAGASRDVPGEGVGP